MQQLNVQVRGLFTHQNPLSEVPPGALVKAKNLVMDKEGIVEPRRGFKRYGTQLTLTVGQKINALLNYKSSLLVHYGTSIAYDSNGSGTWTNYSGSYTAPSGAVNIRGLEANKNFYFTTSSGVKKLDSLTATVGAAGGYKGIDGTATVLATASGFLPTANQVAYRVVWGIKDANGNLVLGAPSQRFIATNSSGSDQDVSLTITIPSGITTSHFYQVYRSVKSGGASTVPNDELGLVYENNPTSGEVSAKSLTFTDSVPESLRGAVIYTAPSQQGISQANDPPPLCQDMCFYKNLVLYANTISKQRLYITLISIGGSIGIQANDTLAIGGVTYTAKATETASSGEFKVTTGGTAAANIEATALSLVRVINQYASNTTYYAYYLSGYNDLPGKILIEERSIGGSTIAAVSSRGGAFNPVLPTSGTTISTTSDTSKNRVYVSKFQQPEAVPIANYVDIGSADKNILRIIALRDSIFVFKEDGVFRITGETFASFSVSLFDVTVILKAAESAVPFNNQIYAYTSQGVVGVSDSGSAIMSRPIEVDLLPVATYSNFSTITFGVAYNSDRKYILFEQSISTDTIAKKGYVFNSISNQWTWWEKNFSCGIVNSGDDKLYFGAADSGFVYQERKDFAISDYADEEVSFNIVSASGATVILSSTTGISVGWTLSQSGRLSKIESIDSATQVTVADSGLAWTATAAKAYSPITIEMETILQFAQNPGILKQYRDVTVFFRHAQFKTIDLGMKSNLSGYPETTTAAAVTGQGFGKVPWGQLGWGGRDPGYTTIRTWVPRNKQRCHWLSLIVKHSIAREHFAVAGFSYMFHTQSERTK